MGGLSVGPWRIVSTTMVALALVTIAPVAASSNSEGAEYSSDTSKANAQRGVRIPSFCYSPWCVFARDTERFPSSGWMAIPSTGWTVYK